MRGLSWDSFCANAGISLGSRLTPSLRAFSRQPIISAFPLRSCDLESTVGLETYRQGDGRACIPAKPLARDVIATDFSARVDIVRNTPAQRAA